MSPQDARTVSRVIGEDHGHSGDPFSTCRTGRVQDEANSALGSGALADLDFSRWYANGMGCDVLYLFVADRDAKRWHRVYCRHSDCPGLKWQDGELWWVWRKSGTTGTP